MIGAICLLASACSQQSEPLRVDVFKHRSTELVSHDAAMVRGDQNYVMYGLVSDSEREASIGHYYTISRSDTTYPAMVKFSYLQAATQSKVLEKRAHLPAGAKVAEFNFIGEEFAKKGKVLAWRVDLLEDKKVIATEKSFMWE